MLEEQLLEEFAERLRDDANNRASDFGSDIPLPLDAAIAEAMLGYLEDAGIVGDHELCTYEDTAGQGRCRIIGYALPEGSTRLELFTGRYVEEAANLNDRELGRLTGQAAKFFDCVSRGDLTRFATHPAAAEAADYIRRNLDRVDEVRIYVLTNATVRARAVDEIEIGKRRIEFSVWDLERLHRAVGEEVTRGRIEVDFEDLLGRPIACLEMKPQPKEYQTFQLILPGKLLYELYEKFGPRLFEFNVRSFLQVKGAVNKGLRDTIKNAPEMFLAYNNGLTATADEIDFGIFRGEKVIRSLKGLQIVNGAQTTASIHRAKRSDKLDISKVSVSMKLTRVEPSKLAEFVPLISKYANTQNPVQMADLSANSEFHIRLEKLAEKLWCPGEESRWFYERARGSYQVSRMRLGATPARRKVFDNLCPRSQQFGKTDLAKYWMSRWLHPHVVSRGAQKNFNAFMVELQERYPSDWLPDDNFFKETIAVALLFKATRSSVRAAGIKSYAANVVTYSLAKLFDQHGKEIDLSFIWETQEVSPELVMTLRSWVTAIHRSIIDTAAGRNVTEWCKREGCWEAVKALKITETSPSPPELQADDDDISQANGTKRPREKSVSRAGQDVNDEINQCLRLDGPAWSAVVAWAALPDRVAEFDRRVAHTISGYALQGWKKKPSIKQARIAARVIQAAQRAGIIEAR